MPTCSKVVAAVWLVSQARVGSPGNCVAGLKGSRALGHVEAQGSLGGSRIVKICVDLCTLYCAYSQKLSSGQIEDTREQVLHQSWFLEHADNTTCKDRALVTL